MKYGIPYKGSKTKIAERLIETLPPGQRFCDLFGGGFAMSDCALRSRKYPQVFYNEINEQLVKLLKRAINGEYSYKTFKPTFITREDFNARKDADGYVRWIWSFGNGGSSYLFGTDIEPLKHEIHDAVVFGKPSKHFPDFKPAGDDLKSRRLQWKQYTHSKSFRFDLEQLERLERLERLQRLQQLEQLERLERLELHCGSYLDYEYRDGDVVYCDPPYQSSGDNCYKNGDFNSEEFFGWAATRDYPVYFSNYDITDDRFVLVRAYDIKTSLSANNSTERTEKLYCNRQHKENQISFW